MFSDVTGIILAGGESRRMGTDKALIRLSGKTLIDQTACIFRKLFAETIIISKNPGRFKTAGCRELADSSDERGAMVGLLTALEASGTEFIFTAACDMPFLNDQVISLIVKKGRDFDVALPCSGGHTHPLHALYSKRCLKAMTESLARGEKSLKCFIKSLPSDRVRLISDEEIGAIDPETDSLLNMNTPKELESVLGKIRGKS
ncbi:MAG: molybdenum cofactor guanylyltransferase [Proteobacteria bacterium]|nr:molybdenum cofactor guanylyltransferase [Pseudomonadota bacterium]